MLNSRQLLGKKGEIVAAKFLMKKGLKVITRNYRCRYGEIDIIAQEKSVLVFIEVKTRSNTNFGSAASAVTAKKQQQISRVAQHYVIDKKLSDSDARFDVIEVNSNGKGEFTVNHLTNAFDLSGI